MEKVTGIGGIFIKAKDSEALGVWYSRHLGIELKEGCANFAWQNSVQPIRDGRTVWSLFPADSDYFPGSTMVNYRVDNLERMINQLRAAGITIEKTETHAYGRFAWLTDPEGNRIELWEPM